VLTNSSRHPDLAQQVGHCTVAEEKAEATATIIASPVPVLEMEPTARDTLPVAEPGKPV
jgi:hypothetical protein